jgi:hypothetical protein
MDDGGVGAGAGEGSMLRFAGRSSGGAARADTLDRPASSGAIADAAGQFRKIVVPAKGGGQVWDAGVRD